ncbi:hypothetical protein HWV00_21240 (plasmid) [Moritella sp. 24]|uniref:hypothetical protein n=1 Tax=Moritella sp. 24 TaxID=2746230 RepID=UPI001BA933F5|nr:hypothetical protein [Moritella sp. 24]QUM78800.1 hypothetical protein HWV00_21240 [Moritella sp. 24]
MSDNINKQQFYNVIKVIEQSSEQELDAIVNVEKAIAKQVTVPTTKRINPRSGVAAGGSGDFGSMPMSAVAPAAPMGDFTRPIKNDDSDDSVKQAERAATSINNVTNNTTNNASSNTVNQREDHNSALSSKLIAQSITESVSSATEQSANKVNATANSTINNNNEPKADNNKSASNPSVSNVDNSSNIKAEQNKQVQHNKSTQVSQNQTNDLLEGLYEDSQGRLRQASGAFASRQQRELHNSSNSNDTAEESTQPSILKALSNWVTGNTISSDNQAVDSAGVAVGSSVWMAAKEVSNVVGDAKNFAIDNNLTTKEGIAGKLEHAKSVVSDPKAAFKNYFSSRQDSNIDSNVEGESQVSTSTSAGGDPAPVTTATTTNSESSANVVAPNVTNSVSSLENNAENMPSVSNSDTNNSTNSSANSTNNVPAPVTATTTNSESNANVIVPNVTNSVSSLENNAENTPSVSNSDTSNSTNNNANATNNAPAPVTTTNSESNANVIAPNVTSSISNLENNTPGSLTSNTNVSDSAAARRKENQGPESAVLINEQTKLQSIESKQQLELLDKINTSVAASGGSSGGGLFGDDGIDLDRKKKGRKKKGHRGRPKRSAMGRMTSVLSTGGEKAASLMTGAKAAGTGLAATGGAGMFAKGASKFVPFLAPLLAAYDGVQGFNDTEKQKEVFNLKEDQAATTGQKSSMALASVLDMGGLVSGGAGLLGGLLGSMGFEGAQQAMSFDSSDMTKGIYSMFGGDSTENTESQTTTNSAPVNTESTTGPVSTEPPVTVSNDTEIVTTSVLGTAAPSIPAATLSGTKVEQSLTPGIDVTKTSLEKQAQREQNAIASEEQETLPGNSNNSAVMSTSITSSDVGDDLTLKSTDNTTNSTEGNQSSSQSTDNQVPVLLNPASKSKDTSTAITESLQSIVNNAGKVLPGSVSSHSSNDDSKLTTQSTLDVPAAKSPALKSSQANPSLTTAVDTTNSNASSMTSTSNASFNVDGTKPDVTAPGNATNNSETNQATSSSTDIKANEPSLIKSIVERVKSTMSIKPKSTSSNSSSNTNTDTLNKLLVDADTTESTQVSAESTSNNANNTTNTPVSAISNSTQGNTSVSSNTAFERTSSRLANTNKSLTTAQYANSMPELPGESPTSITPNNKSSKKKKNEPIVVVAKSDPALTKAMTELVKISKDNKTNGKGSSVTSSNKSTTNITAMNKSGDSGIPMGLSDAQLQLIAIDAR